MFLITRDLYNHDKFSAEIIYLIAIVNREYEIFFEHRYQVKIILPSYYMTILYDNII